MMGDEVRGSLFPSVVELRLDVPEDRDAWLAHFHFWVDFKVRLYETDANGHMSQLTYFGYQELGSTDYWAHLGFGHLTASQSELSIFMGDQYCRFLSEVHYGEQIRMGVRCCRLGTRSVGLEMVCHHADGRLATVGASNLVVVDIKARRGVPIPEGLRQAILALELG